MFDLIVQLNAIHAELKSRPSVSMVYVVKRDGVFSTLFSVTEGTDPMEVVDKGKEADALIFRNGVVLSLDEDEVLFHLHGAMSGP